MADFKYDIKSTYFIFTRKKGHIYAAFGALQTLIKIKMTKGIYYYNTYENHQISSVDMHVENLDSDKMICYPVIQGERINYQNK